MPKLTGWRRVAAAMWPPPNDPQIYGSIDLDATELLKLLQEARATSQYLTPTALVGRAVACALREVPELNARIVGLNAIPRASIDIFFITAVGGGKDLSGVKVTGVDGLSAVMVAQQLAARAARLRDGRDPEFTKTKRMMEFLPRRALAVALRGTALLTERMQLDIPALALHPSPFGSAMITSVGMMGIPHGFAPLSWMYDVPLLVLVGEISERPWVVDHQVVARPVLPITATIDHRYVDGAQIGRLLSAFRGYLENPAQFEVLAKPGEAPT